MAAYELQCGGTHALTTRRPHPPIRRGSGNPGQEGAAVIQVTKKGELKDSFTVTTI
jgi:hypothetical protein